ncbi:hypothetical protein [Pontibacter arcticus]|uniref:Cytochrome C and Quinol oxidase polypeptide I n=1 Tax=Pontibacter arcticus TaxID=2080288 RepID=A0A364RC32_9BACT|nr:hypothetical protein [Pontibacter arcticus]RAU81815.1 hypothetical protein DP923_14050 [Pontibacter arcticus]
MDITKKQNWLLVALLNFVVVALLGLLLRWQVVSPFAGINYKYLLHAHSHVALLGWLYPACFVALLYAYLPVNLRSKPTYAWQFWLSQGAVLGMLLSFPLQGYGAVSITFSTLHILLSYWFVYRFLKDAKAAKVVAGKYKVSFRFIKAALFFLVLSTLGPWAMGPIMGTGNSGTELYFNAIYFYLHFLYNGWFTFVVLGLLCWLLEKYKIDFNKKYSQLFFRLMCWACFPAYLLSVLWIKPPTIVYFIGGTAALAQVIALGLLISMLRPLRKQLLALFTGWVRVLFLLAATAFVFKVLMQFTSAFPYVANLAYTFRNFIIGYLHLVLIGFVSFFILAFFVQLRWLSMQKRVSRWGVGLFILGFISSESILFLQGILNWLGYGSLPGYLLLLFSVSTLMPVGLLLFLVGQVKAIQRYSPSS